MALRHNILANYVSQFYVTVVGVAMVPLYIRHMGAEAYGLVGFFATLQAIFNLLDMGLTPTTAWVSARYRGGAIGVLDYRRLVRALEGVFVGVAFLGGGLLFTLAKPIAGQWLNVSQLPTQDVIISVRLIALIVALRWVCGLYRGVITGAERLVWLSGFTSLVATGRFVLVLPVLMFVNASPVAFFTFQLGVAVFEVAGLAWMAYRLLPRIPADEAFRLEWTPLKIVLKFSLTIAFTSSVWVLVTQTDKIVLSKLLPLVDYGYFSVAVLVASGVMIVGSPISSALLPRMSRLHAEGKHDALIAVYRQATQLVSVTAVPAALLLIFFAPQVLWAWTGNGDLVQHAAPVLRLYAVGYAFLVVGAFPYYLQFAKGDLRLHLIGNLLFVLLLIPAVIWGAKYHGMEGAGWVWLVFNGIYLLLWTPLIHRKLAPGLHAVWLLVDIIRPVVLPLIASTLMARFVPWSEERIVLVLQLLTAASTLVFLAYLQANRSQVLMRGVLRDN